MKTLIIGLIICSSYSVFAQKQAMLKVGEQIEDLLIQNVEHFGKKQITTKDLLGKWTILDFWTPACVACVKSFPKLNILKSKFPQIQFVLITDNGRYYPNARAQYERYRKAMDLELAIAYDSLLFKKLEIQGVPFIVVLDPEGKVRSMPLGTEINEANLNKLITNQTPVFKNQGEEPKQIWKYWLDVDKIDPNNTKFQSILMPYQNEWELGAYGIYGDTSVYQVTGATAKKLFFVANSWDRLFSPFKNEYWPVPILDWNDTIVLSNNNLNDSVRFNYSLLMPSKVKSESSLRKKMAQDLEAYFGLYGVVEQREMPYLRLTAKPGVSEKIRSKENKFKYQEGPLGLEALGITVSNITSFLYQYLRQDFPVVVDETGIVGKIDIRFEAIMTDLSDIQKALKKQGLILEERSKTMKVLTIKKRPTSDLLTSKLPLNEK